MGLILKNINNGIGRVRLTFNAPSAPPSGFDPDALTYLEAVEEADGQALESAVRAAINDFVVGCKTDGIWDAIKASCILAGARTLSGALVPLAGNAPTNFNFVSGDYDRKTGLKGDGSTKYLDSNRNNNADPQDSKHISVYVQQASNLLASYIAGKTNTWIARDSSALYSRINQTPSIVQSGLQSETGFIAANRPSSTIIQTISGGALPVSHSSSSTAPANENLFIFQKGDNTQLNDARLAFYSIGESLDLALLDTRVSNLITAIGAAIP